MAAEQRGHTMISESQKLIDALFKKPVYRAIPSSTSPQVRVTGVRPEIIAAPAAKKTEETPPKKDKRQPQSEAKVAVVESVPKSQMVEQVFGPDGKMTVDAIKYAVARIVPISVAALESASRERSATRPRQVAMYLARVLAKRSLPKIAERFNRDHTTVRHAVSKIIKLRNDDDKKVVDLIECACLELKVEVPPIDTPL